MTRLTAAALAIAIGVGTATVARADDGAPPPRRPRYGWQIAVADGAIAVTVIANASSPGGGSPTLTAAAAIAFVLASPAIHLAHHNPSGAAGGLLLRMVLPAGGAALGYHAERADCGNSEWCGFGGLLLGAGVGTLTALVVDWGVLAREPAAIAPLVAPDGHGGGVVGLAGRW